MFSDLRDLESGSTLETDVCIVGAGPAGISMAMALAGTRTRVLLLESGGFEFEPDTQDLYDGETAGLPYFDLTAARLRYFGGTSGHWDNWCNQMTGIDFRRRDWVPHSGWPIGESDLEPYYARARPICGLDRHRPLEAIWNSLRVDPLPLDPAHLDYRFWEFAGPVRFGEAYRQPLKDAPNVRVLLHANVVNVQTDPEGGAVTRLDLRTLEGKTATVTAQSYVLACGGIENARLLLASNSVESTGVGNRHDLVGRYFQEHILDVLGTVVTDDPLAMIERFGSTWLGKHGYTAGIMMSEAAQEREQVLNCSVMMRYSASGDAVKTMKRLQNQVKAGRLPDNLAAGVWNIVQDLDMFAYNVYRRKMLGLPVLPKPEDLQAISFVCHNEQAPNPDSRVTLTGDRDRFGMQRVRLDWRTGELDKRTVMRHARALGAEFSRTGAGIFRIEPWVEDESMSWSPRMEGGYHHMGTTRMAADPRQGVVDGDCQVHGVRNLYIAGSSVFPTGGNINPTLTIVALALRLADHLKDADAA
ncbi:FAD-dependent oxidoreductase [Arenibaculum pallidiluteum]|uniref:FAD-dependent oxidoreductase n=1 Tax=Arenibaculum pallidiluteum TaxID=2812559 RepID=UPI001A964736|nr:GMC family oxidoreductase [Arenibaculum pallidiluteum]